ncbi:neural proliferation, differentiation and control, 1 [Cichlidogyrus casuarinus]|uniref:Neural proliferation, differentiation and control, 1 n=1 Tax=Cichlidogyrus casuarinus TaxID=1844966 RepID=A0ABD2PUD5_9PLAT
MLNITLVTSLLCIHIRGILGLKTEVETGHEQHDEKLAIIVAVGIILGSGIVIGIIATVCLISKRYSATEQDKSKNPVQKSSSVKAAHKMNRNLATSAQRYHLATNQEKQLQQEADNEAKQEIERRATGESEEILECRGLSNLTEFEVKNPLFEESSVEKRID